MDPAYRPLPGVNQAAPPGALAPAAAAPYAQKKNETAAMVCLGLGIAAWVMQIRFFTSIAAIIIGVVALRKIKDDPEHYGGKGMAQAGIALGAADVILIVGIVLLYLLMLLVPLAIALLAAVVESGAF